MQGFIGDAALSVASVVSSETIAAARARRERAEHSFALFQFIHPQIEEARFVAVHKHNAQSRLRAQKHRERFQIKLSVHEKLGARQLRRQVKFPPEITATAGKYCTSAGLIAVQTLCHFKY